MVEIGGSVMKKIWGWIKKYKIILAILVVIIILSVTALELWQAQIEKQRKNMDWEQLKQYQATYVGDNAKVRKIVDVLPFAKHVQKIELQTKQTPYEITVYYDMNKTKEEMQYNTLLLYSLISNLDIVHYQMMDTQITSTKEEAKLLVGNLNLQKVQQYINRQTIFGDNQAYQMTVNEFGKLVFVNKEKAVEQLKKDAKKGITTIQKEFKLIPMNYFNYSTYGIYGWQVSTDNQELRRQANLVSSFFDIYHNDK